MGEVRGLLQRIVGVRWNQLLEEAIEVAGEVGGSLPSLLLDRFSSQPDPALALRAFTSMQSEPLALREFAALVGQQSLPLLRKGSDPAALARHLANLAVRMDQVGEQHSALELAQEAVTLFQRQLERHPQSVGTDYPQALITLSNRLMDQSHYQTALEIVRVVAPLYAKLSAESAQFIPDLALVLHNHSVCLNQLSRFSEARDKAHEAASIYRGLRMTEPNRYAAKLAGSLNQLAETARRAGDLQGAVVASQEAVALLEGLQRGQPKTYQVELSQALTTACAVLHQSHDYLAAFGHAQQASAVLRELAVLNPKVFLPELAWSLTNQAMVLERLDQPDAAAQLYLEALEIRRRPSVRQGPHGEAELARTLFGLGQLLGQSVPANSLGYLEESARIARSLAQENPATFALDAARSFDAWSVGLRHGGQSQAALTAAQEAVQWARKAASGRPDAATDRLAAALNNAAVIHFHLGQLPQSFSAIQEACLLYSALSEVLPQTYAAQQTSALINLALIRAKLGEPHTAAETARLALELFVRYDLKDETSQLALSLYLQNLKQSGLEPDPTLLEHFRG